EDLADLLAELPAEALRPVRGRLEQLARQGTLDASREAAWAALAVLDGAQEAWRAASDDARGRMDLIVGLRRLDGAPAEQAAPLLASLAADRLDAADDAAVRGRYVRIEQSGCCETQSLAEVEVLDGGVNHALSGE